MKPKPHHAAAHIITSLDAAHEIGEWHEPHGTVSHVTHHEQYGKAVVMKHARLGESGLQLLRAGEDGKLIAVCIPLELLFALAVSVNPQFNAPPDAQLSEADRLKLAVQLQPGPAAE